MSIFVESLKRLYKNHEIRIEMIESLKKRGKITEEEYKYIIGG